MHLIIYGPEGSGKGTQAKLITEKYKLPVFTSGDLVRDTAKNNKSLLGEACRTALSDGKYVDDNTMFALWTDKLGTFEAKKGFVLDGFPRNINQAEFLFREMEKYGYSIDKVIFLQISDDVSRKRLALRNRPIFEGSSVTHDSPERVNKRLESYHGMEKLLLPFFEKKNLILKIQGEGTVEEVFGRITSGIGKPV
jgi:adenylate kinase